tara:strand:+ start:43 stop:324 length:282 start_codon:yes stop_codon:yes gene_type:complete
MTLGGANVWSNFSYGYRIDSPSGWLLNPEGNKIILFELFKKSPRNNIKIQTAIFYTNHHGQPAGIKSTKLISIDEAWNEWHDLQLKGWTFEKP